MKRYFYAALTLLLAAAGTTELHAQAGIGKKFNAHDPRTCSSVKEPSRGAPSVAQVTQYFICGNESYSKTFGAGEVLALVSDVKIEIGKGRPFNPMTDSVQNIDPSQTIYPIRGSYTAYSCGIPGQFNAPADKNCMKGEGHNLSGMVHKDAFGDWHAAMCCILGSTMQTGFPPPTKP